MQQTITPESFDSLTAYWAESKEGPQWSSVFILPVWMKVWWQIFQPKAELYLRSIRQNGEIIGIAPMLITGRSAGIVGSADVCDYLDFVIVPGMEKEFYEALLTDMKEKGVSQLDLHPLRPDSTVLTHLVGMAESKGYEVITKVEDVSVELDLPPTWDEYLQILDGKQRHEVRRKIRRLQEAGTIDYQCTSDVDQINNLMDTFLKMFVNSREDKATFLTSRMENYFRTLVEAIAQAGLLRMGVVNLDSKIASMIIGFDYNNSLYLYNSAYDPGFRNLSVGLICKLLCLKQSIEEGKKKFNFLKGSEVYKYRIGGKEVPIYNCQIKIS